MHIYIITSGILLPYVFLVYALIKNYAGCNFHSAEDVPEIHFEKQFQCNLQHGCSLVSNWHVYFCICQNGLVYLKRKTFLARNLHVKGYTETNMAPFMPFRVILVIE